jgi:hypothetical protein
MNAIQQSAIAGRRRAAVLCASVMRELSCLAACCLTPTAAGFAADPPLFVIHGTRDVQPAGPLVRLAADGTAQVGGASPVRGAEIVAIRRQDLPPPRFPHDRPYIRLANGDRIPGRLLSIVNDKARFLADLGTQQEITLPLSAVSAAWLTDTAVSSETPAGWRLMVEKRGQDIVQLTNGDTAAGTIVNWQAEGPLRLDAAGRQVELPRDRVQALLLNSDLARATKPRISFRQLVLINGARLSASSTELAGEELKVTLVGGVRIRIPLPAVAAINVYRGPAVYLSDLIPRSYEQSPYLGVHWPLANDRSVAGGDIRLGGGTYDKGLGLHSQCRVTYSLPPGATRFEAIVGLDDVTGRSGAVRVQVLADGKLLLDPAPELAGTDPPRALRLPLPSGAKELMLLVDFGRGGDVQDHVDWADARIIVGNAASP